MQWCTYLVFYRKNKSLHALFILMAIRTPSLILEKWMSDPLWQSGRVVSCSLQICSDLKKKNKKNFAKGSASCVPVPKADSIYCFLSFFFFPALMERGAKQLT